MRDRTSIIISALGHAGVFAWTIFSFHARPLDAKPVDSIPVDIISDKQFSEMTAGLKAAKAQAAQPKPFVEKTSDTSSPVEDAKAKVSDKKEITPTQSAAAPPEPPKPEKPQEAKPKEAKPKPDPIAEALKRDEAKKFQPEKKAENKPPAPQKKPPQERPFDADRIAALLDKRDPQRQAATGAVVNTEQTLGTARGSAAKLSQNEIDALRRRIQDCWTVPVGAENAQKLSVVFRVIFRVDGTVAQGPDVVQASASSMGPAFAESGRRAILQCQPYTMLRKETYEQWKDLEIQFSPTDMFRG